MSRYRLIPLDAGKVGYEKGNLLIGLLGNMCIAAYSSEKDDHLKSHQLLLCDVEADIVENDPVTDGKCVIEAHYVPDGKTRHKILASLIPIDGVPPLGMDTVREFVDNPDGEVDVEWEDVCGVCGGTDFLACRDFCLKKPLTERIKTNPDGSLCVSIKGKEVTLTEVFSELGKIYKPHLHASTEDSYVSTKHNSRCLTKAADDEPIFVLRANDPTAPNIVREWAKNNAGVQQEEKIKAANSLAVQMEEWRTHKYGVAIPAPTCSDNMEDDCPICGCTNRNYCTEECRVALDRNKIYTIEELRTAYNAMPYDKSHPYYIGFDKWLSETIPSKQATSYKDTTGKESIEKIIDFHYNIVLGGHSILKPKHVKDAMLSLAEQLSSAKYTADDMVKFADFAQKCSFPNDTALIKFNEINHR